MYALIHCEDYRVVKRLTAKEYEDGGKSLPEHCLAMENLLNDGMAVLATQDGSMVADADGWIEEDNAPADPMLAAMERRFD